MGSVGVRRAEGWGGQSLLPLGGGGRCVVRKGEVQVEFGGRGESFAHQNDDGSFFALSDIVLYT